MSSALGVDPYTVVVLSVLPGSVVVVSAVQTTSPGQLPTLRKALGSFQSNPSLSLGSDFITTYHVQAVQVGTYSTRRHRDYHLQY